MENTYEFHCVNTSIHVYVTLLLGMFVDSTFEPP